MKDSFARIARQTAAMFNRILSLYHPRTLREKGKLWASGLATITLILILFLLGFYWSIMPPPFDVRSHTNDKLAELELKPVTGSYTTVTLLTAINTLLEKSGGYLSNDITPPSVFLDNMPNWEFGVLTQVRDLARSLRNDMSRSQSQSLENKDLAITEPQFNYSNDSWIFPSTEGEYRQGIEALKRYLKGLSADGNQNTQFYARADNLRDWLAVVEKRLGSLSQRLSASVGQQRINTDLAGDPSASQSTATNDQMRVQTPWLEIDDVFYEARGSTWALIHFLQAVEIDFYEILRKKNALVSLRQIIRELEATQAPISSPVVLNGKGFGMFANYSLVMASYISRANAAVIDLRNLLSQG
ncbi:MAG: DUF2333 family protein [Candidatus Thiodiazotropha sp. 'RUGA']|nr:DUF2333 family protein [Candidatus Thiodiazotropha sp. 'RUGA']